MRWLALLIPFLLIAGCTQLDDAKTAAVDAQEKLDAAKREAQEAKDRYERVRSATIVRTEKAHLEITGQSDGARLWFVANATRGETVLAPENFTSLPLVTLSGTSWNVTCDPLDCAIGISGEDVRMTWADGAPGEVVFLGGAARCESGTNTSSACAFATLVRDDASIQLTTAASDVTV